MPPFYQSNIGIYSDHAPVEPPMAEVNVSPFGQGLVVGLVMITVIEVLTLPVIDTSAVLVFRLRFSPPVAIDFVKSASEGSNVCVAIEK